MDADVDSTYTSAALVEWNSNVIILSGPNPDLFIDANGNIVRAINVSVNGGQKTGQVFNHISVDPIINNNRGQVLFQADNSGNSTIATSLSKGPLVTFRETYDSVSLFNESGGDLEINNIQVFNNTPLEPGNQVTLDANTVSGFQFSVNHDFKPTTIDISEVGPGQDRSPSTIIEGTVNNPIGVTYISDYYGNIYSYNSSGVIITDYFYFNAADDIGLGSDFPLYVQVIDSNDGPTDPSLQDRSAYAGYDADMDIQGIYRVGPPGNVPANGYTTHIDRINAGHDVNLALGTPLVETTVTPFTYDVRVDETGAVHSPDSPNPMTVIDHFRPGTAGSTPTVLPVGIFGTTGDFSAFENYNLALPLIRARASSPRNNAELNYYNRYIRRERLRACRRHADTPRLWLAHPAIMGRRHDMQFLAEKLGPIPGPDPGSRSGPIQSARAQGPWHGPVSAALVWHQYGVLAHDPSVKVDHPPGNGVWIIPPLAVGRGLAAELSGLSGIFQELDDLRCDIGRISSSV